MYSFCIRCKTASQIISPAVSHLFSQAQVVCKLPQESCCFFTGWRGWWVLLSEAYDRSRAGPTVKECSSSLTNRQHPLQLPSAAWEASQKMYCTSRFSGTLLSLIRTYLEQGAESKYCIQCLSWMFWGKKPYMYWHNKLRLPHHSMILGPMLHLKKVLIQWVMYIYDLVQLYIKPTFLIGRPSLHTLRTPSNVTWISPAGTKDPEGLQNGVSTKARVLLLYSIVSWSYLYLPGSWPVQNSHTLGTF